MCLRRWLACLVIVLGLAGELPAAELTARWIGAANGDWKTPANWDIDQIPNNTDTDTYDVIWDGPPVTISLDRTIVIRNFTFASGGVLTGPFAQFKLTIEGAFQWSQGTLRVNGGAMTVLGTATLQGLAADSLKLDGGLLSLKGHTELRSTLQCLNNTRLRNEAGAVFEAHDSAGLVRDTTQPAINNYGTFRVLAGAQSFPCIWFINFGVAEVTDRTVEFQTGQFFSDFDQQDGKLHLAEGAVLRGKITDISGSHPGILAGNGQVRNATVFGRLSGRLSFDTLLLGANATSAFNLGGAAIGSFDHLVVAGPLALAGKIEVNLTGGFVPAPADGFEIVTTAAGVSGQFNNVNFGQRVPVADGAGTFRLALAPDSKSVVLSDFVAVVNLPPQLEAIPDQTVTEGASLAYQLQATDPDVPAQPLSYTVLAGPAGLSVSPTTGLLTWTPTLEQAGHPFPVTVRVTDSRQGQAERTFTVTVQPRNTFFAHWTGTTDGDWNNPANWDIGRVPNNSPTEAFIVLWDAHPVTIRVTGDVAVRSLSLRSGGTLDLRSAAGNFGIKDSLQWTDGTLAGPGRMTVHGRADLHGRRTDALTLRDQCRLVLKSFCELETPLRCDGNVRLVVEPTATLGVAEGGAFEQISGVPELFNEGTVRVWSSTRNIRFIFLRNRGTVTVFASTLDFISGTDTDLIQEPGGSLDLGAGIGNGATIQGKALFQEGSTVFGDAHMVEARIEGQVQGRLRFDKLSLGPTATGKFALAGARDLLSAKQGVTLAGRLEPADLRGFTPGPDDVFELVTSNGGITGEFDGIAFGQRLQLPDGSGSLLLTLSEDSRTVVLGRFLPPPVSLAAAPLTFRLPEADGPGGCFVVPHPAINLPAGNWAAGRLEVEITDGFDPALDRLEFRPNPTFSKADDVTFEGPPDGMTVSFHGTAFGTARIVGGRMTCLLSVTAQNEAIVALLGRLHYGNSELTPDWFTQAAARYPRHAVAITLTDPTGMESRVSREVSFPYLLGIRLEDSLLLPAGTPAVLQLQGVFSSGPMLPVRQLAAQWSESSAPGVLVEPGTGFPGEHKIIGKRAAYCSLVTASAGALTSRIAIYEGHTEPRGFSGPFSFFAENFYVTAVLTGIACPVLGQFRDVYILPDCPSGQGTRARRPDADAGPASAQSPVTFYALETLMKGTAAGQRWVDLYRQHGAEVVRLFVTDPSLLMQAQELITAHQPGLAALLAGKGDTVTITPAMVTQVNAFWSALARHASPALKTVLEQEQARFDGFQSFSGRSFAHWAGLLGIPVSSQPQLHIALTRREGNRFHLGLNDVPGADLSLWRSPDLGTWERVPNAEIQRDGVTLLFTDPAAPAGEAFYQIRQ